MSAERGIPLGFAHKRDGVLHSGMLYSLTFPLTSVSGLGETMTFTNIIKYFWHYKKIQTPHTFIGIL